ncbi:MAG: hypothetical protein M1393_02480, partial [Candidatus Thermoplasmatota archaeon]|nr:hypothetical protein [Candidatus Thermoplasmatota archaeon]
TLLLTSESTIISATFSLMSSLRLIIHVTGIYSIPTFLGNHGYSVSIKTRYPNGGNFRIVRMSSKSKMLFVPGNADYI